jgi:hypothetical protein
MPPSQLSVSGIRGQKRQLWATQTMQDVISPKAFEQWTKDRTIPKTPDDLWSASDMRKAHTFKKRQWKLSKPDFKHLELDTVSSMAIRKQARQKDLSVLQHKQPTAARQATDEEGKAQKEAEQEHQRKLMIVPDFRAQSQARTRFLNEAFRGLLSPAQQRRAVSHKEIPLSEGSYVSEALLTKRIMNLITIYEPGNPLERVSRFLKPYCISRDEEMDISIASENVEQTDGQDGLEREEEERPLKLRIDLANHLKKWKTAAEELKEAVEMKWPEESKKRRMKIAIEQEMEENRTTDNTILELAGTYYAIWYGS